MKVHGLMNIFVRKRPQTTRDDLKRQTIRNDLCKTWRDDITSYEEACKDDHELQSFDSDLLQIVEPAIDSLLDTNPKDRPLSFTSFTEITISFTSFTEITDCLVQISRKPAKFIVESTENVSNNEAFSLLVSLYLEITNTMLEFANALETEVTRAKISRMTIRRASKSLDMEVEDRSKGGRAKQELKKFKVAGEPFKDVFKLLEIVYDQQVQLLEKLHEQKRTLNKKPCKRVYNVMFATASASLLILSVAMATAPTVAQEVARALSAAKGHAGRWCREAWGKYEQAVEGKTRVAKLREIGDIAMVKGFKNIDDIIKILEKTQAAGEDEAAEVRRRMKALTEEFDGFVEKADELGQKAAKYIRQIVAARSTVMEQKLNLASVS